MDHDVRRIKIRHTTDHIKKTGREIPIKKKVLVAFGDVTGFSNWSRRTEDDGGHFLDFMEPLSMTFSSVKDPDTLVKKYGDGLMIVMEVTPGKEEQTAVSMMAKCFSVLKKTEKIIKSMNHPKPIGFRIRIIGGPSWKWKDNGEGWDFYGKTVNTAKNLLNISKLVPFIVHATFMEMVHPKALKRLGIHAVKLEPEISSVNNIDPEDLDLLYCLRMKRCSGCRICVKKARKFKRP